MSNLTVLKLGGSVITAKGSGKPRLMIGTVRRLAREIAAWRSTTAGRKTKPLILLYGGGSFGHPLAHQYRLQNRILDAKTMAGAGRTIAIMRELGNTLTDIFFGTGIPIIPLQTSSFVRKVKGRIVFRDLSFIETILKYGGVPFFGGDVIFSDGRRSAIVSADELASALAAHFRTRRILFATDVDGVYQRFPPRRGEKALPTISRRKLHDIVTLRAGENAHDVTGAMAGKLRALLSLRNCEAVIFNALKSGVLGSVLRGASRGTTVTL